MSAIMKALILFSCVLGFVLCQVEDEEHQHLHDLAANIMQNLQKEHIPSEGSTSGIPNAPINHLLGSQLIGKTDKIKITVGVKGTQFVSVEANGSVVNISTTFGVGAVAVYNVIKDDIEEDIEEIQFLSEEKADKEVDAALDSMQEEYLSDNLTADPSETKVIVAKKAKFDMKIKRRETHKEVKVTVDQGYIVAAKMNVTKGYTDPFLNY